MRRLAAIVCLGLVLASCSGTESDLLTVVASSPGSVALGQQRLLLVVASPEGELVGGPDDPATATFTSGDEVFTDIATEWVWGIQDVRGFYVANFHFPGAGMWEVWLTNDAGPTKPSTFQVTETAVVPEVGMPAPRSDSATSADAEISEISTDTKPDPSFYRLSVAEAVANGRPTVIIFATPAFCQTAVCGPMLDLVKSVAPDHPQADFVHVEVYENIDDPEGPLVEAPAVIEWGLQTEPWVFVIDDAGRVAARFEGAMGPDELERALAAVGA